MTDTYDLTNPSRPTIVKDPNAILDYTWDWAAWLTPIADTINSIVITAQADLTVVSTSNTTTKATAFISGGTLGKTLSVSCKITTVGLRTDERTIYLKIQER